MPEMEEKEKYRVTCIQGNGYHCGCCRAEENEYEDFDDLDSAMSLVKRIEEDPDMDASLIDLIKFTAIKAKK